MITQTIKTGTLCLTGFLHHRTPGGETSLEIGDFLTIGRDHTNSLSLTDEFVSIRHARVEQKPTGFLLRDLRSRNGTFVNGARVFEALLMDGDRIRFGSTEVVFSHAKKLTEEKFLTSKNEKWNEALLRLPSIAASDLPVLLSGPSGTGKEVLAEELHRLSARNDRPFVSVNCSALGESLVESELFGHLKGSFTGATNDRKGAFEAARGGTLFLDEIGDLPLPLQPKLLRALENRQIRPVGSDKNIETDVRIIAATHHRLKQKVLDGSFRADLYFRLHVAEVCTPSLTERIEDFEHLLYMFGKSYRVGFSFAAIQKLKEHSWPGNIRELKNMVARAKAYFPNRQVEVDDLEALVDFAVPQMPSDVPKPSRSLIREIEHEMIRTRLIANRGNQRKTATDLGMPKSTLHDRIRDYGINVDELLKEAGV
jgi:DNA-binding NtrC family response regulator